MVTRHVRMRTPLARSGVRGQSLQRLPQESGRDAFDERILIGRLGEDLFVRERKRGPRTFLERCEFTPRQRVEKPPLDEWMPA